MLIDFDIDSFQLLSFTYKGYFDRLLEVISFEQEEGIRRRAVEQYLKVIDRIRVINQATSEFLLFKIRSKVQKLNNPHLMALLASVKTDNNLI